MPSNWSWYRLSYQNDSVVFVNLACTILHPTMSQLNYAARTKALQKLFTRFKFLQRYSMFINLNFVSISLKSDHFPDFHSFEYQWRIVLVKGDTEWRTYTFSLQNAIFVMAGSERGKFIWHTLYTCINAQIVNRVTNLDISSYLWIVIIDPRHCELSHTNVTGNNANISSNQFVILPNTGSARKTRVFCLSLRKVFDCCIICIVAIVFCYSSVFVPLLKYRGV